MIWRICGTEETDNRDGICDDCRLGLFSMIRIFHLISYQGIMKKALEMSITGDVLLTQQHR
jgi:hypothetical protein